MSCKLVSDIIESLYSAGRNKGWVKCMKKLVLTVTLLMVAVSLGASVISLGSSVENLQPVWIVLAEDTIELQEVVVPWDYAGICRSCLWPDTEYGTLKYLRVNVPGGGRWSYPLMAQYTRELRVS